LNLSPFHYEETKPNSPNIEYKVNPTPIKIMINLTIQGNLGGGKKALMPITKKKTPIIKLIKNSNKHTSLHNFKINYDYHS